MNIAKAARLQAEKRMTDAGLAAYALRKEARSAVYSHEQKAVAELKSEELAAFRKNKAGWAFFEAQPAGYRKRVMHWITTAKQGATRSRRLAHLLEACGSGERLQQFK